MMFIYTIITIEFLNFVNCAFLCRYKALHDWFPSSFLVFLSSFLGVFYYLCSRVRAMDYADLGVFIGRV